MRLITCWSSAFSISGVNCMISTRIRVDLNLSTKDLVDMKFKQLQKNYRLGASQLIARTHLARNYWWRSWKTWMLCYCRILGWARHPRRSSIHLHRTSTLIAEFCTYMLTCPLKKRKRKVDNVSKILPKL